MSNKSKLASFQGYNSKSQKIAFCVFSDDLGVYFLITINCVMGFESSPFVSIHSTWHEAKSIMDDCLH